MGKLRRFTFYKLKWIKWVQLGLMLLFFHASLAHNLSYLNRSNRVGFEILKKDQKNEIASREKYSYDVKQKLPEARIKGQEKTQYKTNSDQPHYFFIYLACSNKGKSPQRENDTSYLKKWQNNTAHNISARSFRAFTFSLKSKSTIPSKSPNPSPSKLLVKCDIEVNTILPSGDQRATKLFYTTGNNRFSEFCFLTFFEKKYYIS
jgi:hypothetical protein